MSLFIDTQVAKSAGLKQGCAHAAGACCIERAQPCSIVSHQGCCNRGIKLVGCPQLEGLRVQDAMAHLHLRADWKMVCWHRPAD